jgi:copper transport protein
VAIALWLAAAGEASAHALLLSADPAPGALLASAPPAVRLQFSEPVSAAGPGLTVVAPSGRRASRTVRVAGADVSTAVAGEERGTYVVTWEVVSPDTHPSRGQFQFSVGFRGPPAAGQDLGADVGSAPPAGLLLQTLGRWLHFIGLALALGVPAFQLLVQPSRDPRLERLLLAGVGMLAAAEPVALAGQSVTLGLAPQDLITTGFGRVLGLRLGGAFLLWTALGAIREAGRGRALLMLVGAAILFADGLGAHRIAGLPDLATFALGAVHEGAMAVWMGGLVAVLATGEGGRRFGPIALACFLTLVASGGLLALGHLSGPQDLLGSPYGVVLGVKVVAVAGAALIAVVGARRIETVALSGVLVLAALLASLPPPR